MQEVTDMEFSGNVEQGRNPLHFEWMGALVEKPNFRKAVSCNEAIRYRQLVLESNIVDEYYSSCAYYNEYVLSVSQGWGKGADMK